jgi:hypothetical protein
VEVKEDKMKSNRTKNIALLIGAVLYISTILVFRISGYYIKLPVRSITVTKPAPEEQPMTREEQIHADLLKHGIVASVRILPSGYIQVYRAHLFGADEVLMMIPPDQEIKGGNK